MSTGTFLLFSILLISVHTSPIHDAESHLASITDTGAQTFASSKPVEKFEPQPQLQNIVSHAEDDDHDHDEEGHSHDDGHSHGEDEDSKEEASKGEEPAPTEEADATSDGVCVDAMALAHLSQKELVFDQHRLAVVLCDAFGSCATAGHMVVWNGKGMMMKKYCAGIGGCEEKQIYVNSPKWKRRTRIESKTNGLEYTAFAARYETRVEEMVLRTAVHAGL